MSGILLTAGYDRAWHSVFVAESLRRAGYGPALILLALPVSAARLQALIRNRGWGMIAAYLTGRERAAETAPIRDAVRALGIKQPSLRKWARKHSVPLKVVGDLNSTGAVRAVAEFAPLATAYTGGGILRHGFLQVSGPVVNAHSGPLPTVRGMNALEWSLLLGQPTGVTMHLIDEGIDTGRELEFVPVPARRGDSLDSLRERLVMAGAEGLVRWIQKGPSLEPESFKHRGSPLQRPTAHRQCFVVAPALRELAMQRVATLGSANPGEPIFK